MGERVIATTALKGIHLNALYDLCSKLYVDGYMQPRISENENTALAKMVDRSRVAGPAIVIADRNYECYNTFAHIFLSGSFVLKFQMLLMKRSSQIWTNRISP